MTGDFYFELPFSQCTLKVNAEYKKLLRCQSPSTIDRLKKQAIPNAEVILYKWENFSNANKEVTETLKTRKRTFRARSAKRKTHKHSTWKSVGIFFFFFFDLLWHMDARKYTCRYYVQSKKFSPIPQHGSYIHRIASNTTHSHAAHMQGLYDWLACQKLKIIDMYGCIWRSAAEKFIKIFPPPNRIGQIWIMYALRAVCPMFHLTDLTYMNLCMVMAHPR